MDKYTTDLIETRDALDRAEAAEDQARQRARDAELATAAAARAEREREAVERQQRDVADPLGAVFRAITAALRNTREFQAGGYMREAVAEIDRLAAVLKASQS